MAKTRNKYPSSKKLEVLNYALIHGTAAAEKWSGIEESNIRRWKRQKHVIKAMKPTQYSLRYGKAFWPQIEPELKEWVLSVRSGTRRVTKFMICLKAQELAQQKSINDFKGSRNWCTRFMDRHNLSWRARTSVGQKLPNNWIQEMNKFDKYIKEKIPGIHHQQVGNMDEVPVSFDMPGGFTVEQKGATDVKISTTGNEKCNFTVVLCVTANGGKCKPLVIFKRKTIPKEKFPKDIIVNVNPKGWMTSEMFSFWLENVWAKRTNSLFSKKSLLIYDSARPHITPEATSKVKKYSIPAVIPGGLTSKLQPLDLSVNRSFKTKLRQKWEEWMTNGYHTFTKSGSMRRASYAEVCQWVSDSWKEVTVDCIKNGFRAANICDYPKETLTTDITIAEEDSDEPMMEAEDNLEHLFDNFTVESDEEFDGFD